jgi:hypothetical protein
MSLEAGASPKADLHMHEGEIGPVVDYIYEAAVRPELWRPALDRLASASNALGAQMLYHRPEGAPSAGRRGAAHGLERSEGDQRGVFSRRLAYQQFAGSARAGTAGRPSGSHNGE